VLRTYVRSDQYTIGYGNRSRLEVPIGSELTDELGVNRNQRLRVEIAGDPKWSGKHNGLEIVYDELADTFRAFQPVTIDDSRLDSPLASEEAALDVGAKNLVACTVSIGSQFIYDGRDLFEQFREITEQIAHYQSLLEDQRESSKRIDRLYRKRNARISATTPKTVLCVPSLNACTMKAFQRCTLATPRVFSARTGRGRLV
jgi:Probable transposase.